MSVHVTARPFPGHEPAPAPDSTQAKNRALASARTGLAPVEPCATDCASCAAGWRYERHTIGACAVCGEPCRSWDPDDRPRHPTCELGGAA